MATAAMKKRRIEEEETEEEASQIPDDKEGLLEFMDQRAKSIQCCKDQISIFERKVLFFFLSLFFLNLTRSSDSMLLLVVFCTIVGIYCFN